MAIEEIDIGNSVQCDGCGKAYRTADDAVNLPDSGGFLFGSASVRCPSCGPAFERGAIECNEAHLITARCPAGMSFADWVLRLRGGNNKVRFLTGEDALRADPRYDKARQAGEILQRIYDSETAGTLRWFFDAGFEWELWGKSDLDAGEDGHGLALIDAVLGMAEMVTKRSPEGEFARWWRGRA